MSSCQYMPGSLVYSKEKYRDQQAEIENMFFFLIFCIFRVYVFLSVYALLSCVCLVFLCMPKKYNAPERDRKAEIQDIFVFPIFRLKYFHSICLAQFCMFEENITTKKRPKTKKNLNIIC